MVNCIFRDGICSVYEIYPKSESPHLTQIAHHDVDPSITYRACLLPGTVICYGFFPDRIVFRVWDYRLNHSISFSADVELDKFEFNPQVYFLHFFLKC